MNIRFVYTALQVKDLDKSVKFYRELLGMTVVVRKLVRKGNRRRDVRLKIRQESA